MPDMTQFSQMFQDPTFQRAYNDVQKMIGFKKAYKESQKQERLQPTINALSGTATQYKTAQTDEQRQAANTMANQIRSNFLIGGGSPSELGQQYYGSDPTQGFQTSEGFQTPVTGFEGLERETAIDKRRQAFADMFEKKKYEMSKEGQDWYLPLTKQNMENDIALQFKSINTPSGRSSGSSLGTTTTKPAATLSEQAKTLAKNDPRLSPVDPAPEGYYTLDELTQAWFDKLTKEKTGGNEQSGNLYADEELQRFLK
jgi:hypothetical protein